LTLPEVTKTVKKQSATLDRIRRYAASGLACSSAQFCTYGICQTKPVS